MLYTIDSDEEIEPEVTSDEEVDSDIESSHVKLGLTESPRLTHRVTNQKTKQKHMHSKNESTKNSNEFQLDFDDGEYHSRQPKQTPSNTTVRSRHLSALADDLEANNDHGNELSDKVRQMPHSDERISRAEAKLARQCRKDSSCDNVNEDDEDEDKDKDEDTRHDGHGMSAADEASFFDTVLNSVETNAGPGFARRGHDVRMFTELNLSRSLLRGVEAAGYITPTPVQASVIPLALAGRDVCASAATGSGKTAAFLLPCLERLQFRARGAAAIRILVVTPTRELATQIYAVLQQLSRFTDVTSALICGGGKDLRSQEATLRLRPDVVVCTPGRMLDHLRNSRSIHVGDLDVLVLDEVDRLLDLGFEAEIAELVKLCPVGRQTLLFSATLTSQVDELARLSLRRPVRVKANASPATVAPRLVQEFVKLRSNSASGGSGGGTDSNGHDADGKEREAVLVSLVCRHFNERTIVFCETKKETARVYLLLRLMGIAVAQLRGDLTQAQRYQSLEQFRAGAAQVLVATDVAARGLDIPGVLTVINAEMPRTCSTYIHRVGRTARAGCSGRSVTLVTDARRKVVKELLKSDAALSLRGGSEDSAEAAGGKVLSRAVPAAVVAEYVIRIAGLEESILSLQRQEAEEAKLKAAQGELERAENLLLHETEIASRPARTWHETETQKQERRQLTLRVSREESEDARAGRSQAEGALERQRQMERMDDYREEGKGNKAAHRLSRKKRRRLEAIKGDDDEHDEDDAKPQKRSKLARDTPVQQRVKKAEEAERSLAELGLQREVKKRSRLQLEGREQRKESQDLMRPRLAVGGLDLGEVDVAGNGEGSGIGRKRAMAQQRQTEAELAYEVDPNKKLRKGGKVGSNAFKSKKRYKRR